MLQYEYMTDKTRLAIAKKINDNRLKQAKTQSDIAKKAGITSNYFARIERGEVKPSMEIVLRIIKALNVDAKDILGV